ncbi:EAL domain-containing protein (plasmid) [Peteryoungia desertarenae]|uniref:EAL domain-containing protein n=1 Tax=Peteryoungia desertarenae TaxID=1813451 RepID=A0ABX6QSW7_9HYPH|nr:EAL domain-containing protein [Peteryoungia desertarenae]QLF71604.1 EAL domain-containing protein [Peteryoungia desertarenae]
MTIQSQISLIRKNYLLAIGILAAVALCGAVLMHWAGKMQTGAASIGTVASQQTQAFMAVMTASRMVIAASERSDASDADLMPLRRKLASAAAELEGFNRQMKALLDAGEGQTFSGIPEHVVAIYRQPPHRLEYWLDFALIRAKNVSEFTLRELRYHNNGTVAVDIALQTGDGIISGFKAAMREIETETRLRAQQLRQVQIGLTVATLLILALETGLIFGPLIRRLGAEYQRAEDRTAELRRKAFSDSLTGIANRRRFHTELESTIPATHEQAGFAVVVCDINRFKSINDSFGHDAGDALLIDVAERLTKGVGAKGLVARLGGDEFAVLGRGVRDTEGLTDLVERVRETLTFSWRRTGFDVDISASVGGALCLSARDTPDRLLAYADQALYEARNGGRPTYVITPRQREVADEEAAILRDINRALSAGEFEAFYQPKIHVATRSVIGVEALVRWRHGQKGLLPPALFLPAVQRAGKIADLTRFMLDAAGRDMRGWIDERLPIRHVAVNMPEALLASRTGLSSVIETLERHGLEGSAFTMEITEDVLVSRAADTIHEVVNGLSQRGVRIAFDDFGTGFASLSHLREFTFDEIKIDRSFVKDIGVSDANEQIVRSIISLAKGLNRSVVAEGSRRRSSSGSWPSSTAPWCRAICLRRRCRSRNCASGSPVSTRPPHPIPTAANEVRDGCARFSTNQCPPEAPV